MPNGVRNRNTQRCRGLIEGDDKMRDPYLVIIMAIRRYPGMPLKFYIDNSKVSRGTFFKVKGHLEQLGIVSLSAQKRIILNVEHGLRFLAEAYPGVKIDLDTVANEPRVGKEYGPSSDGASIPVQL